MWLQHSATDIQRMCMCCTHTTLLAQAVTNSAISLALLKAFIRAFNDNTTLSFHQVEP